MTHQPCETDSATVLPAVAPADYPDRKAASQGLKDAFHLSWLTPENIADELVAWVDAQKPECGKDRASRLRDR